QSNDDGIRSGGIRRLSRRDRAPRVLAPPARVAPVRRQEPAVSPGGRTRLDPPRCANPDLVDTTLKGACMKEVTWQADDGRMDKRARTGGDAWHISGSTRCIGASDTTWRRTGSTSRAWRS